jgi:hypothetical protein
VAVSDSGTASKGARRNLGDPVRSPNLGVSADKPEKGKEVEMPDRESDMLIVVTKQGNACGAKMRGLGIPTVEDPMVQMAMSRILEAIFEQDFFDFSYGFRPGRNCHQALAMVDHTLMWKPINYVIDADIKGFFDNVNHEALKRCLEERISDRRFIRYIVRFLKSGIMEAGKYFETGMGTPQNISKPIPCHSRKSITTCPNAPFGYAGSGNEEPSEGKPQVRFCEGG